MKIYSNRNICKYKSINTLYAYTNCVCVSVRVFLLMHFTKEKTFSFHGMAGCERVFSTARCRRGSGCDRGRMWRIKFLGMLKQIYKLTLISNEAAMKQLQIFTDCFLEWLTVTGFVVMNWWMIVACIHPNLSASKTKPKYLMMHSPWLVVISIIINQCWQCCPSL